MNSDLHFKAGDRLIVGEKIISLDQDFVSQLQPGDKVLAVAASGTVKRIPAHVASLVDTAMSDAEVAFHRLSSSKPDSVSRFFDTAANLLSNKNISDEISAINRVDVESAQKRGRSTTRLVFSEKMCADMVESFRMWRDSDVAFESKISEVKHTGWVVEQWRTPLGVIGFVFEGRPNVFADATGVLRSGNTVVFRIGSDALNTAKAIMRLVIAPALTDAGLPKNAVVLLDSPEHAAGWALFSDTRLALAVARGSGEAVAELGSIARQSGVSVSLHGTGGAWMIVGDTASTERLSQVVTHSLDRKVCNTLNVVCVSKANAEKFVPVIFAAAEEAAAKRNVHCRVHAVNGVEKFLPSGRQIMVLRATGVANEDQVSVSTVDDLSHEFEWESNPEFFVVLVDGVDEAIDLFNTHSPQFVVSVVTEDDSESHKVWQRCNAPFVGDGFTRWVDGQFALLRPELGLSNWEGGRLFARGGVLSGDSAFTVRLKVRQEDAGLHR